MSDCLHVSAARSTAVGHVFFRKGVNSFTSLGTGCPHLLYMHIFALVLVEGATCSTWKTFWQSLQAGNASRVREPEDTE